MTRLNELKEENEQLKDILVDLQKQLHTAQKNALDKEGKMARELQVNNEVLEEMREHRNSQTVALNEEPVPRPRMQGLEKVNAEPEKKVQVLKNKTTKKDEEINKLKQELGKLEQKLVDSQKRLQITQKNYTTEQERMGHELQAKNEVFLLLYIKVSSACKQ